MRSPHPFWIAPFAIGAFAACAGSDTDPTAPDAALVGRDAGAGGRDAAADDAGPRDGGGDNCAYPGNPASPMALDRVLFPHRWATAIDGLNRNFALDLTEAHCDTDDDIDWSPFDVLLFVSVPAW